MQKEIRIIDWQTCETGETHYRSIEEYLQANTKSRYDQHGVIGDRQLELKVQIATQAVQADDLPRYECTLQSRFCWKRFDCVWYQANHTVAQDMPIS